MFGKKDKTEPHFRNEAALQSYCIELAERLGILAWGFKSPGLRGVPDVLLMFDGGRPVFVEFKHPSGKGVLSENQKQRIAELTARGVPVYECYQLAVFEKIIEAHI